MFRYDVNALRVIAVFSVVIYHFNLGVFNSGFVGVDVFFVISGYLMTKIITKGLDDNNFSYIAFTKARFIRIVPPLLVLIIVLSVYVILFTNSSEVIKAFEHIFSSLLFFSNYTYLYESGYFDAASMEKWLLHTWSLSVEWQFYMLLPILLILIPKRGRLLSISLLLLCSLFFSVIASQLNSSFSYYSLPSRMWAMLAGVLAYLIQKRDGVNVFPNFFGWVGIVMIILSGIVFDSQNGWPNIYTIIPVLGTVFVLMTKLEVKVFQHPVIVYLGKSSYSLYLWHWPFVVYMYKNNLEEYTALFVLLAFILSCISYSFVEKKLCKA